MSELYCLFDRVRCIAQQSGDRTAVIRGSQRTSYSALDNHARRVCNGLLSMGLEGQSRVAYLGGNRSEFFDIWQGTSMAGHVVTPINARLGPSEIKFIINDSETRVLFIDQDQAPLVDEIAQETAWLQQVFILGHHADRPAQTETSPDCYFAWRNKQSKSEPTCTIHADDTVVQMYTSGTTGFPKGVELGHSSVLACVGSMMGEAAWPAGEITLVTAPLFHTAGSAYSHCALQSGGTVVLLEELSPASVLEALEYHAVNQALLVPALIRMVLDSKDCAGMEFPSLRRILYGASPIPVATLQEALELFTCNFEQGYGLTETVGPVAVLNARDHAAGNKLQSCGKAVAGSKIRVVDPNDNDCAIGEVGEIIVSGQQLMKAYWNRPKETLEVMHKGWLRTGDAGYFDTEGYLYIHARIKDMIVSGGENVYPAEVEIVLADCPGVAEAAVIGVPDKQWGEAVKAVVVKKNDSVINSNDIITYTREHIADFKCPKSVDFVDSIPRNPAGKILKKALRGPYWAAQNRKIS